MRPARRHLAACLFLCGVWALDPVVAAPPQQPSAERQRRSTPRQRAVTVLVVNLKDQPMPVDRIKELGFPVEVADWQTFDPRHLMSGHVILLPTNWAYDPARLEKLDAQKQAYHEFVRRGGGLVVCPPNPRGHCTPELLPYPIKFRQAYDKEQPERVHVAPKHYITSGLPASDLPFPADPMIEVDRNYKVLAVQKSTRWASLAVCDFGKGRVVVQTANENNKPQAPEHPLADEILRRMILWAAGRNADSPK